MSEVAEKKDSKRVRKVLTFKGSGSWSTQDGVKYSLSFLEKNPYKYDGQKCYEFVMKQDWLKSILEYSQLDKLVPDMDYDVLLKYNHEYKSNYIVAIFTHDVSKDTYTLPFQEVYYAG